MIRIENLSKDFGNVKALMGLNLKIKKGEFFAFLGPNAAGKTTTIKLMTGLLRPTKGRVFIGGYNIQTQGYLAKSLIGYIPEYPYLYDRLTAREFVVFISQVYNLNDKDINAKIEEMFELFGLVDFRDTLISDFSHGLRQRLLYVATLIHEPKVLIIDEPLIALDPQAARLVKDILKEKSGQGVTIFISTHILSIAEELADRIGIIDKGRLVAEGSFQELKRLSPSDENLEDVFLGLTHGPT